MTLLARPSGLPVVRSTCWQYGQRFGQGFGCFGLVCSHKGVRDCESAKGCKRNLLLSQCLFRSQRQNNLQCPLRETRGLNPLIAVYISSWNSPQMRPKSLTAQHWELFYTRAMICRLHLICPTLVLFVSLQRRGLNADCKAAHTSATSASCCLKAGNRWVMWPFGCCWGSFVLPVAWAWISVRLNQLRPIF